MHTLFVRISTALTSIIQHKLRSTLSVTGVICGVMAVVTMVAIGEGAKRETIFQIEKLGLRNIYIKAIPFTPDNKIEAEQNLSKGLRISDAERIQFLCQDVKNIAVYKELQASLIGTVLKFPPKLASVSETYSELFSLSLSSGRFFSFFDIQENNSVCVLGANLVSRLGTNGRIGSKLRLGDSVVTVVGILNNNDNDEDKAVVFSLNNYNDVIFIPIGLEKYISTNNHQTDPDEITEIIVKVGDQADIHNTTEEIKRLMHLLHNTVEDYTLIIPQELIRQANKTRRVFNIVLGSIAGISLLVGGIGIMNIMLATVTERTKEIGIRRAIGAGRKDIIFQFLAESTILTLAGGLLGVVAGIIMAIVVSSYAGWPIAMTMYSLFLPFVMSLLVGIFFGLYPAIKAANMHPIHALRHE